MNRDKGTDYIFIIGPLTCFVVEIFTAHFLERYQERYLEPNHIDLRGTIPALYFLTSSSKRGQPIYIQKKNATKEDQEMCNYLQTEQGLACIKVEGKILTYITFINQDGLSRYKQSIYEEREVIDSFRAVFRENNSFDPLTWRALRNKLIRNKERSLMLMKRYCARLKRWGMDEYYEVTKDLIQYFEDNWDNLVKMAAREEAKYKRMKNEQIRKKLKFHLPPLPMSFTKDPNIPSEDPS